MKIRFQKKVIHLINVYLYNKNKKRGKVFGKMIKYMQVRRNLFLKNKFSMYFNQRKKLPFTKTNRA